MTEKYFSDPLVRFSANTVILKCRFSVSISYKKQVGVSFLWPISGLQSWKAEKIQNELQTIFHYAWQSSVQRTDSIIMIDNRAYNSCSPSQTMRLVIIFSNLSSRHILFGQPRSNILSSPFPLHHILFTWLTCPFLGSRESTSPVSHFSHSLPNAADFSPPGVWPLSQHSTPNTQYLAWP